MTAPAILIAALLATAHADPAPNALGGDPAMTVRDDATSIDGDDALTVEVLSFNIRYGTANDGEDRWENRRDLVSGLIRDVNADAVGLQEALKFQIDQVLEDVPAYRSVGVGRDDGREAGEFSAILYRADRWKPVESETFWFSDTPERPGSTSWGNSIPRICTFVRLREKATGRQIDVYNVHLDHRSAESRHRSAALLAERISAQADDGVPAVVTGDFNAAEDAPPITFLKGKTTGPDGQQPPAPPFVDTFRILHPDAIEVGTFNGFRGRNDGAKIDYILIPEGSAEMLEAEILRTNRDGRYPSDHYPVSATLRYPG